MWYNISMSKVFKGVNFAKLFKNYKESGWAGISDNHTKVVVWGKTLKEARKKAEKLNKEIYFFPTGRVYDNFIG